MQYKKEKDILIKCIIIFFAFLSVLWMLTQNNSLTYDDFTTIANARFTDYSKLFHFLPTKSYNDRPIGLMFIKMLDSMFGLNYQLYHIVFAIIHMINIYMVYRISQFIFNKNQEYALVPAAIFGIYPISLMAVSWISAVYDLLCCTFLLLSTLFFLKCIYQENYKIYNEIMSCFFFYIALRSKEMALILPIIFILYLIGILKNDFLHSRQKYILKFHFCIMFIYTFMLFNGGRDTIPKDNPYYQNFSPISLIQNAIKYLFIYFDWGNSTFGFRGYTWSAFIGVLAFIVVVIYSLYRLVKKDSCLFLSILAVGVSLAVVLPMVNMQHRLYLYIPSIFVGIMCAIFLLNLGSSLYNFSIYRVTLYLIGIAYLINFTPGYIDYRNNWLHVCQNDAKQLSQLEKLIPPAKGATVYVTNASEGYNIFYYGPGNSLRLLFNDSDLKINLVDTFPENPEPPYLLLNYNQADIIEMGRDDTPEQIFPPEIVSVYPEKIDTTASEEEFILIGVVPTVIHNNLKIVVNGTIYDNTTIGSEFISTAVPRIIIKNDKPLELKLLDTGTGLYSGPVYIGGGND